MYIDWGFQANYQLSRWIGAYNAGTKMLVLLEKRVLESLNWELKQLII